MPDEAARVVAERVADDDPEETAEVARVVVEVLDRAVLPTESKAVVAVVVAAPVVVAVEVWAALDDVARVGDPVTPVNPRPELPTLVEADEPPAATAAVRPTAVPPMAPAAVDVTVAGA